MSILQRYAELHPNSALLARRAQSVFPDGVTHDIRHNSPFSLYAKEAHGSRKIDVDGNEIVDYVMGHGALLLGHGYPAVVQAVAAQLAAGTHLGASHEGEIRWGELVQRLIPSAERLRFTSSGTEATMMALRLARRFTGRDMVVRFSEHFHGWNDAVTGQPRAESTTPFSAGIPAATLGSTIVLPQNDLAMLEQTLADQDTIAAVILEPTGAHWGEDPIEVDFVRSLRELTDRHGVVLIFDEVITGFRVSEGGAQLAYGITPDMTTLAKIVAGGLPGGCVAGRREILDQIALGSVPSRTDGDPGRIAHPGTFNANPLSAAAGAACLAEISNGEPQRRAAATAEALSHEMNSALRTASVAGCVYGFSSMLHITFGETIPPPDDYSWHGGSCPKIAPTPAEVAHGFRLAMINEGVDLMGLGLMVSGVHDQRDIDRTVAAFEAALVALKAESLL